MVQPQTIYVRLPNWVGDMVMLTPSLRTLKNSFPDSKIIGVGRPFSKDILGSNAVFDDFFSPPRTPKWRRFLAQTAHAGPGESWGVLYTHSLSSALEFASLNLDRRIGYQNDGRSLLLTDALAWNPLAMDRVYGDLTAYICGMTPGKDLELRTDSESKQWYAGLKQRYGLESQDLLIGLNPGAGYGETKRWWIDHFIQLGRLILQQQPKARLLVFSGPDELALGDRICEALGHAAIPVGRSNPGLNRLKACFDELNAHVTNDSGLRWFSAAKKVPTLVLFGSSDPELTACFLEHTVCLREPKPCSPCGYRVCPTKHECMRDLRPERVFEELDFQLGLSSKRS